MLKEIFKVCQSIDDDVYELLSLSKAFYKTGNNQMVINYII